MTAAHWHGTLLYLVAFALWAAREIIAMRTKRGPFDDYDNEG